MEPEEEEDDVVEPEFDAEGNPVLLLPRFNPEQHIMHLNEMHAITFGELEGGTSERVEAIADAMAGANFAESSAAVRTATGSIGRSRRNIEAARRSSVRAICRARWVMSAAVLRATNRSVF